MYNVKIVTDAYKPRRGSKKNWEPGTMNDFMAALNGWKCRESNIKMVKWRLELFLRGGITYGPDQRDDAEAFLNRSRITYRDKLCGIDRTEYVECPNFHQGYVDIDKIIEDLKKRGSVRVPFSWAYDTRQYLDNMDGCYMEIEKAGNKKGADENMGGGDEE